MSILLDNYLLNIALFSYEFLRDYHENNIEYAKGTLEHSFDIQYIANEPNVSNPLAYNHDDTQLAIAGAQNRIWIYSPITGNLLKTLDGTGHIINQQLNNFSDETQSRTEVIRLTYFHDTNTLIAAIFDTKNRGDLVICYPDDAQKEPQTIIV